MELGDYQRPKYGIYAVRVTSMTARAPRRRQPRRPPDFEPSQELLEAYVFGFDGDLYGRQIEVALHAYIREEEKFDVVDALVARCATMRRTRDVAGAALSSSLAKGWGGEPFTAE